MGSAHTHRSGRRYNNRRGRNNQGEPRNPEANGAQPLAAPQAPHDGRSGLDPEAQAADPNGTAGGKPARMSAPAKVFRSSPPGGAPNRPPEEARRENGRPSTPARPASASSAAARAPQQAWTAPQRGVPDAPPRLLRPGDPARAGTGKRQPLPYDRSTAGEWAGPARDRQSDTDQRVAFQQASRPPKAQAGPLASEPATSPSPAQAAPADASSDGDLALSRGTAGLPDRTERGGQQEREPLRPEVRADVGPLIDTLRGIFERDRSVASQGDSARCGICYLHFSRAELVYREAEGFYVCGECMHALGPTQVFMVRRQQK